MQLFNVTLHQNSICGSLRLGLTFQIENPLSCRRVWGAVRKNIIFISDRFSTKTAISARIYLSLRTFSYLYAHLAISVCI